MKTQFRYFWWCAFYPQQPTVQQQHDVLCVMTCVVLHTHIIIHENVCCGEIGFPVMGGWFGSYIYSWTCSEHFELCSPEVLPKNKKNTSKKLLQRIPTHVTSYLLCVALEIYITYFSSSSQGRISLSATTLIPVAITLMRKARTSSSPKRGTSINSPLRLLWAYNVPGMISASVQSTAHITQRHARW